MKADLHLHTSASDGALSPAETVAHIASLGAELIAVTDHDTVDGLDEAAAAARDAGVKFVPGIEISARSNGEIHILGYDIDYKNPLFVQKLQAVKEQRRLRNIAIGERLAALGVAPEMDFEAKGVGRKNIAAAMVAEGKVASVQEAFDRYLGQQGAAYVAAERITPLAAVGLIAEFGGVPVLAHPKKYLLARTLGLLTSGLSPFGLAGIEVFYPGHTAADIAALTAEARRMGLVVTGGSDYHGDEEKNFVCSLPPDTLRALGVK